MSGKRGDDDVLSGEGEGGDKLDFEGVVFRNFYICEGLSGVAGERGDVGGAEIDEKAQQAEQKEGEEGEGDFCEEFHDVTLLFLWHIWPVGMGGSLTEVGGEV